MSDNLRIWEAVSKTDPRHVAFGDARLDRHFWSKVSVDENGCWVWQGVSSASGYGILRRKGRNYRPHRYAYEALVAPVSVDLDCDHLCRNRLCANPLHIEPVSRSENVRRGDAPRRMAERFVTMTHCKRGHEFTDENTYRDAQGRRVCRTCRREQRKAKHVG